MQRPIDQRFRPPVAGIDLEQSLNYIELDMVGEEFCYEHYTSSHLPYVQGNRPQLEKIACRATQGMKNSLEKVQAIAEYVATEISWAGYYEKKTGSVWPADQALSEERILEKRVGWCNEQARVFCCLSQVVKIPSRIVFAVHKSKGLGHCMSEVMLPDGWLLVDQSIGFCFLEENVPRRASQVRNDACTRAYFLPRFKDVYKPAIQEIGNSIMSRSFKMIMVDDPLTGLKDVGFHNHYLR